MWEMALVQFLIAHKPELPSYPYKFGAFPSYKRPSRNSSHCPIGLSVFLSWTCRSSLYKNVSVCIDDAISSRFLDHEPSMCQPCAEFRVKVGRWILLLTASQSAPCTLTPQHLCPESLKSLDDTPAMAAVLTPPAERQCCKQILLRVAEPEGERVCGLKRTIIQATKGSLSGIRHLDWPTKAIPHW